MAARVDPQEAAHIEMQRKVDEYIERYVSLFLDAL